MQTRQTHSHNLQNAAFAFRQSQLHGLWKLNGAHLLATLHLRRHRCQSIDYRVHLAMSTQAGLYREIQHAQSMPAISTCDFHLWPVPKTQHAQFDICKLAETETDQYNEVS